MNNAGCKMSACIKPMLISTIAVAIVLFGMEYVIHGMWLKPIYEQTPQLWRPMAEMGQFPLCIIRLLVLGFLISALYCKCKKAKTESCDTAAQGCAGKECPMKKSLCFGVILGALLGTLSASAYLWMPISAELAIKWFIAGLAEGIVISAVLSSICCNKKGECKA